MIITPIKTGIFQEGEDLFLFVTQYIKTLREKSVVIVTSKIVALAERRTAVVTNEHTKEKLIRSESDLAIPTQYGWLTIKDGAVMATAGIDESNGNGKLILLPKDSFRAAGVLRRKLKKKYHLRNIGVIITDSRTMPFRSGVMGIALGYAGFRGVKDYRGTLDIFGRSYKYSRTDVAGGLAAAAVLAMGEGNERRPLAIIQKASIVFCEHVSRKELMVDVRDDMYLPLFRALLKSRRRSRKSQK